MKQFCLVEKYANQAETVSVFYFSFISPCATGFRPVGYIRRFYSRPTNFSHGKLDKNFKFYFRLRLRLSFIPRACKPRNSNQQNAGCPRIFCAVSALPRERWDFRQLISATSFIKSPAMRHFDRQPLKQKYDDDDDTDAQQASFSPSPYYLLSFIAVLMGI